MRRVSTPESRRRERRRAAKLQRRQKRLSGPVVSRVVKRYGFVVTLWDAARWNLSDRRAGLREMECPPDCYVMTAESVPVDPDVTDDGVVVVTHVELGRAPADVVELLGDQVAQMMDTKFGRLGWLRADAVHVDDRR